MRIEANRHALAVLALLGLAGCTEGGGLASTGSSFGEASRQTFAAQVIDPAPQYADAVPVTSGQHAALASEKYATGKVEKPERTATSSLGSGSMGGR